MRRMYLIVLVLSSVVATAALLTLGCRRIELPQRVTSPTLNSAAAPVADVRVLDRTLTLQETEQYAGDAACASCHPSICAQHAQTGHAHALRRVTIGEHGYEFRSQQKVLDPDIDYTFGVTVRKGTCVMTAHGPRGDDRLRADLALGSGQNGQTFLSHDRSGHWTVLRISYYSRIRRWEFTPQQGPGDQVWAPPAGREMNVQEMASCLSCHATYLCEGALEPDFVKSQFGVGCERCHGPGRSHSQSARALEKGVQQALVHMEDLRKAPPPRVMEICGHCHSTESDPRIGDLKTEEGLPRFQATALARSRCFRESHALSCTTCHDSHAPVDHEAQHNEAVCLRCHAGAHAGPRQDSENASLPHARPCKVDPRRGCIRCHMPAQPIVTIPHAHYHNHWIKVWPAAAAGKGGSLPRPSG